MYCVDCRAVVSLNNHGQCGNCESDALVVDAPPLGHMLVQASDDGLHHIPSANIAKAKAIDPQLTILYVEPSLTWTSEDRTFLMECGIVAAEPTFDPVAQVTEEMNQRLAQLIKPETTSEFTPPDDGTTRLLKRFGIPVTIENYLELAFAGIDNVPEELDGEIQAELERLQIEREAKPLPKPLTPRAARYALSHAETESMTAGDCGEPNYTTPSGIPICSKCGKSTRNRNELMCAPCRNRTRLLLTETDRKFLREIGISR